MSYLDLFFNDIGFVFSVVLILVYEKISKHVINVFLKRVIQWVKSIFSEPFLRQAQHNIIHKQELSHDSIARLNCALPITKTISVIW